MHSHVTCIRTTCVQTTSERDVNFKTQPITQPGRGCAATAMTTATTTTAAAASWLGLAGLGLAWLGLAGLGLATRRDFDLHCLALA